MSDNVNASRADITDKTEIVERSKDGNERLISEMRHSNKIIEITKEKCRIKNETHRELQII